ncbi:thioredoxin [Paenibacillus swuensis]|uniref:Thioredoxin n=1 Tax=Paenibacillus swuensis TaxID=1178515 RepID=A0A172TF12_9BACL|nr:thioredoxin domain-containing protein [Paenibacillus swuensis]ANE45600.1 thioredoxin [Paenibacillus swuensis]
MSIEALNDSNFPTAIAGKGTTLVDFTGTWCPPCKVLLPLLEELQQEMKDTVNIYKADVKEAAETASAYGIMSTPTVIVFRDGVPVDKLVGLRPKQAYVNVINKSL